MLVIIPGVRLYGGPNMSDDGGQSAPQRARVYVVDDDPTTLLVVARILNAAGYDVERFESPVDFLSAVRAEGPCCLLLDLKMPELDGLDVVRRMPPHAQGMPIVFLSGSADVPSSVRAMKAGAVDFLCKPIEREEILRAVQRALERDEARRSADHERQGLRERLATLSERERTVCEMAARGLLNKEIASELNLHERTVKYHRARGMVKLGATSVPDLVRLLDRARDA